MTTQITIPDLGPFMTSVGVPTILTLASAILEVIVKGISNDDEPYYRVWIEDTNDNKIRASDENITFIKNGNSGLIEIEPKTSLKSISNFGSVAISLIIGAFTVDITSLLDEKGISKKIGGALLSHLLCLIAILLCLTTIHQMSYVSQTNFKNYKGRWVLIAIILGFIAMMSAFFST